MQNTRLHVADGNPEQANVKLVHGRVQVTKSANTAAVHGVSGEVVLSNTTANVGVVAGVHAKVSIQGAASQLANVACAVHAQFDHSGGANTTSNAVYGMIVDRAKESSNSASAPTAYIGFGDEQNDVNPVPFLFDIGRPGKTTAANTGCVRNTTPSTSAGALVVRVNGATRYIQLFSAIG
jgi:hypothetical protein